MSWEGVRGFGFLTLLGEFVRRVRFGLDWFLLLALRRCCAFVPEEEVVLLVQSFSLCLHSKQGRCPA